MKRKADVKISLHFIVGLIFSVILILLVLGGVRRLTNIIDPHYERDLVDQWAKDIEIINQRQDSYATELLSLEKIRPHYFIGIFQSETEKMNFDIKGKNYDFIKPRSCRNDACICTYNIDKHRFEYCKRIGARQITALTIERKFSTSNGIAIFTAQNFGIFGLSRWQRDDKQYEDLLIATNKVYAQIKGSWIEFCFNVKDRQCEKIE
jgi:hypothetical protein